VIDAIVAHLVVDDADRAATWYARAFGAVERRRVRVPDGRLMSVELELGAATIHLADQFEELGVLAPPSIGGTATVLALVTDDADALWERAVGAGADVLQPLADAFWGERHGQLADPFGHRWNIAQHLRDVPDDELARAAAAAFGSGS
jgi:uncharacterized glyoxalase superfamily protein PhnB